MDSKNQPARGGSEGIDSGEVQPSARPHPVFYLSGYIVVFKVQDILFKVDPVLFTKGEDSAFKTMLTLPQEGDSLREGLDDANPIILQGDTPAEFESLIWGLHSQRLSQANIPRDDIERFIQLARISHKYDLRGLETWATSGLSRLSQNDPVVRRSQAAPFLDVFALCNCKQAVVLILATMEGMLHEKTCSTTEITAFIDLGERFDLPKLVGLGYYTMLFKPRSEWQAELSFTHVHQYRLLSGHYILSEYSLEGIIESLKEDFKWSHATWDMAWSTFAVASKELELRSASNIKIVDVVGRLRCLLEGFLTLYSPTLNNDEQKSLFRGPMEKRINTFIENELPKCFGAIPDV